MSSLTIVHQQFPTILPETAKVGDHYTLTVTGTIRRIEADEIDATPHGGPPNVLHGQREIELTVTAIGRQT